MRLYQLAFLSFLQPVNLYAGIEDDYRRQQEDGECSSENVQFFSKDYKYCVSGGYWTEYSSSVEVATGVLNKSIKNLWGYITKVKIEGNFQVFIRARSVIAKYQMFKIPD